jgi:hypothetical protein
VDPARFGFDELEDIVAETLSGLGDAAVLEQFGDDRIFLGERLQLPRAGRVRHRHTKVQKSVGDLCLRVEIDLGTAEERRLSDAGREHILQFVAGLFLQNADLVELLLPALTVEVKPVQLHFGDRHHAFIFEPQNVSQAVGRDAFLEFFADLGHDSRVLGRVLDLRMAEFFGPPIADLFALVQRPPEKVLDDIGQPVPPLALTGRDQYAGEIGVIDAANLGPEMVAHPFGIKFGVVGDLGLFGRREELAQGSKRRVGSQRFSAAAERLEVDDLGVCPVTELHQPQIALVRIKVRRLNVKAQKSGVT